MFTGLIEEVGTITAVDATEAGSRITVAAQTVLADAKLGDSIAIDGACTTVVAMAGTGPDSFAIEASPETLSKTNFSAFKPGRRVNLERPLTPESRIGGHYVTGHVDGLAKVVSVTPEGNSIIYVFEVETPELAELFVSKGSVTVLGISLTVNVVEGKRFSVAIIPHTLAHTNLGDYEVGDSVNIETDLLGKYVRRLLFERGGAGNSPYCTTSTNSTPGVTLDAPTLNHSLGLTTAPGGVNIHTGGWFCHDLTAEHLDNSESTQTEHSPSL